MENNDINKADWLKAGLLSPNNTLGDFKLEGLTPQNTQLLSPEEYKEKDFIKETFVDAEGKFNNKMFETYYEQQKETYNNFAKDEYDDKVLNSDYFAEYDPFAPKDAKRGPTTGFKVKKIHNPLGNSMGTDTYGTISSPEFSIREIAQTQKIFNPISGEYENQTPNDKGFWKTLFGKDTLVLSQWDTDGEHYDPISERNVKHKAGDLRFNEFGKPQYEVLGDRPAYGKNVLSPWMVSTTDGSFANKFDFMDSDGLRKSFSGTLMQTAAKIAPFVIPKVKNIWTPISIGSSLITNILPVLGKSGAGLLFGDSASNSEFVQNANYWESVGKRFSTGVSDEGSQSTFNKENIFAMAGDVFGQIAEQRALAKIPMWLGANKASIDLVNKAKAGMSAEQLTALQTALKGAESAKKFDILRTAFGSSKEAAAVLNKWQSFATGAGRPLGVTYMAAISGAGMFEEAKLSGLDDRDAAALTLGGMAALGTFMATNDIGGWTLKGIGLDDVNAYLKRAVKENAKELSKIGAQKAATNAVESAVPEIAKKAWYTKLFDKGKSIMSNVYKPLEKGNLMIRGAYNEALEEMSEEAIQDAAKGLYNAFKSMGMTSTKGEASFDVFDDMLSRYAMAALGGAMGGGLTGAQDALAGRMYHNLPETLTTEIISAVMHGHADGLRNELTKQYKKNALPGNDVLTPIASKLGSTLTNDPDEAIYEAVSENNNISQSEMIYRLMMNEIDFIEKTIMGQYGDLDNIDLAPIYKSREASMIDLKHNSAIRDDVADLTTKLLGIQSQITSIEGGIKDATQEETKRNQEEVTRLKLQARPIEEELANILNGRKLSKYVGHALFHMNKGLSNAYGVKDIEDFSQMTFDKPYAQLNENEKQQVDEQYKDYENLDKRKASLVAYEKFKRDTKFVNEKADGLKKWSNQRRALLENHINTVKVKDPLTNEDYEIQAVLNNLIALNQNLETAVQSDPQLIQATQTDLPIINENSTKLDIYDAYFNILSKDAYINPEMVSFLNGNLSKQMDFNYIKNGEKVGDVLTLVSDSVAEQVKLGNLPVSGIYQAMKSYLNKNKDAFSYKNYNDTIQKLNSLEFLEGGDVDQWLLNNLLDEYGESIAESLNNDFITKEKAQELINSFKNGFSNVVASINEAFKGGLINNNNTFVVGDNLENANYVDQLTNSAEKLTNMLREKAISPFHETLSELARIDGVEGLEGLFDTISRQYDSLNSSEIEQFIISSKLDADHLKYAQNVLARARALIMASTTFDENQLTNDSIVGYNAALNNISIKDEDYEVLPEFDLNDADTIYKDISVVEERLNFLTNLSDFNINGTVRESKVLGARALTLYLKSISPNSKNFQILKNLNLDTTELEALFNESAQYQENIESINAPDTDTIPFNSSDEALRNLRLEADKIEQEIYKLFNADGVPTDVRSQRFLDAINNIDLTEINFGETTSFNQRTKSISRLQEIVYLFQTATVDVKQFYKDVAGDIEAERNNLTDANITPFLNQEIVIKQLYFSVMSKYKDGIDVYNHLVNKILPVFNAKEDERNLAYGNREDIPSLTSAIFLDGIPGAGKTSTGINTLNKILAKYNLNLATFAPYKEQVDNLNNSLEYQENLINSNNGTLDYLFEEVLGAELYNALKQDLQNIPNEDSLDSTIKLNKDRVRKRLEDNPEINKDTAGFVVDTLNTENPKIVEFLNNFKRLTVNGRIPNVIAIDEATHIQVALLDLLNRAITIHNNNTDNVEKISLVLLGDTEQNGATATVLNANNEKVSQISNLNYTNVISTPKLSQSFRSSFSTISDNINRIRVFKNNILAKWTDESTRSDAVINELELKYTVDNNEGLIGFKSADDFTELDVKVLFEKASDKVAIITDKLDSPLVSLAQGLGYTTDDFEIITPNNVQGLERDYVMIDLETGSSFPINYDNRFDFIREVNSVYTALSRAKKGALITNDSTAAIKLNTNSDNVSPYKIELNASNLERYKNLTVDMILNNARQLEDLPQHISKNSKQVSFEKPTEAEDDTAEVILTEAMKQKENKGDGNVTKTLVSTNNVISLEQAIEEVKTSDYNVPIINYMYHEHLGFLINPITGKVRNDEQGIDNFESNNSDGILIAKLLGVTELTGLNENINKIRNILKSIRTASMYIKAVDNTLDFKQLLFKSNVDPKLINNIPNIVEDWDLNVLVKPFGEFDMADPTAIPLKGNGNIAYLVLVNPNNKTEYITLSALPNVNNTNFPDSVIDNLKDLYITKENNFPGGKAIMFPYTGDLKLASNLELRERKTSQPLTYNDFKSNNPNLTISDPFVISGNLFNSTESKEIDSFIKAMSSTVAKTEDKNRLRGLPFILVSTNKNISNDTNSMLRHYKEAIKATANAGTYVPSDIRLIGLRPKSRSFSEWFEWNAKLGIRYNAGEKGIEKELAAAENNYVAAKILARFTFILSEYNKAKKNQIAGAKIDTSRFLPESLVKTDDFDVESFMNSLQQIMDIAIPATMRMTYLEYIGKLTGFSLDSSINSDIAFNEFIKDRSLEITELQRNFYNGERGANTKATEHQITKSMLNYINNSLNLNDEVSLIPTTNDSDLGLVQNAEIKLNKDERGALINMVVALRTAMSGGSIRIKGSDVVTYQQGVFSNSELRNKFLKQLDKILTDETDSNYDSLFPGGIYSNITYRRRTDANKYVGVAPFNMETGVKDAEITLHVDVQLPKLWIDFDKIVKEGVNLEEGVQSSTPGSKNEFATVSESLYNEYLSKINWQNKNTLEKISELTELNSNINKSTTTIEPISLSELKALLKKENISNLNDEQRGRTIINNLILSELQNIKELIDTNLNSFKLLPINKNSKNELMDLSAFKLPLSTLQNAKQIDIRYLDNIAESIESWANLNNIYEEVISNSLDADALLKEGYQFKWKSKDGETIFLTLNNSQNSIIFGKFVLDIDETTKHQKTPMIRSTFELLHSDAKLKNKEPFENFKDMIKDKFKDNKMAQDLFDDFVTKLEQAVATDFVNYNNKESVKELSRAYLDVSMLLKNDNESLKALQDFYKDFVNTKKC